MWQIFHKKAKIRLPSSVLSIVLWIDYKVGITSRGRTSGGLKPDTSPIGSKTDLAVVIWADFFDDSATYDFTLLLRL